MCEVTTFEPGSIGNITERAIPNFCIIVLRLLAFNSSRFKTRTVDSELMCYIFHRIPWQWTLFSICPVMEYA